MSLPAPTETDIQRIVDLVVAEVQPLRVVLFGSASRGEHHSGSDLDVMVIVQDEVDSLKAAQKLYLQMARQNDIRVSVDFVVTTLSRYEQRSEMFGSVFNEIARDGRELYAA